MSIVPTLRFIASHPLSSQRPLAAYWRYGKWQVQSRLRRDIEFRWIGGSKLIVRKGMTGATGNVYVGLHEFFDMAFLLHLLRPADLFVDVGANVGSYTVLASAVCQARAIAIEPDPDTMRSLMRNVEANELAEHVVTIEAALGSAHGSVKFTIGQDTTNRVATDDDAATRTVPVRTLDDVLRGENPVLIKMDVEGYEPEVMTGSIETLQSPSLLALVIETVDERVLGALGQAGFRRASYEPFSRQLSWFQEGRSRTAPSNSLFVRDLEACRERVRTAPYRHVAGAEI